MYTNDFLHSNNYIKNLIKSSWWNELLLSIITATDVLRSHMGIKPREDRVCGSHASCRRTRVKGKAVEKGIRARRWNDGEREMERVGACRSRATGDLVVYLRPSRGLPLTALLDVFPADLTRRCSQTIAFPLAMKINRRHTYRVKSRGDLIDRWESSSSSW